MKQCPNCKGLELYDDTENRCPYCDAELVPYIRRNTGQANSAKSTASEPVRPNAQSQDRQRAADPVFESQRGGRYTYRGVVVSITPTSRFMPNLVKWFNAFFRGQPFQIGNPVHETVVRIEEIGRSKIPDQMRNLVYYGELAEADVGDDVTVSSVRKNGRLIIRSLQINDTGSKVRVHNQIPAAAIRVLTVLTIALVVLFVSMLVSFFTSGGIWTLLGTLVGGAVSLGWKLVATLSPLLVLLFVCWLLLKR